MAVLAVVPHPTGFSASPAQYAASVTAQPPAGDPLVGRFFIDPAGDPQLDEARMTALIREKIKYVFVIYNENQSFDHEYGTFPGANGIYADGRSPRSAADTPGFTQTYKDNYSGETLTVRPFLLGPAQNGTIVDSVDHSHTGLAAKLRVVDGKPTMAGFAQDEFGGKARTASNEARGRQFANIVMSHIDCDTIPFFWLYASRFTLFDNIFATEDTPSTPNAIAMIAGQAGETQWVKHGAAGATKALAGTINGIGYDGQTGTTKGFPLLSDPQPYWGSQFDDTAKANREPAGPKESFAANNIAANATFASIPLTAAGINIRALLGGDLDPAANQADIQKDIPAIAAHGTPAVAWRWYQNGYDHEPTDPTATASHENFVAHHEGPQYFGYIADNTNEQPNLEGEGDFFSDVAAGKLPATGGIIYIRGGYANIQGLKPPIQNPAYPRPLTPDDIATIQSVKAGDDDHPAYADRQISEAMNARVINAVASNPALWAQSAIVITYDESDGFYDHVPPRILSLRPGRAAARARHPRPAPPDLALRAGARGVACRRRPQRHHRDDQPDLRPAGSVEPARRGRRARRRRRTRVQPLRTGRLQAEVSRTARHQFGGDRQPDLGLRPAAAARPRRSAARILRDDPGRCRGAPAALRRPRLRDDRHRDGGSPAGPGQYGPGGL